MKKFSIKRLLLRLLLIGILLVITIGLVNAYYYDEQISPIWGDKYLIGKQNFLYKNRNRYNTLFIGSSKTHYQIAPAQFDSIVNASGADSVHSYNFGIDGMLPPESFYVCKQLLDDDRLKLKNLVIELNFIKDNQMQGAFSWRNIYWLNNETYGDYYSAMMQSNAASKFKYKNIGLLSAMYMRKVFHPTKFRIVSYYRVKKGSTDSTAMYHGFEPLELDRPFRAMDSAQINYLTSCSKEAYRNYASWSKLPRNEAFAQQVNRLTELAESKGIRVFYFFPTQWSVELYKEMFPILNGLPDSSKLLMGDINGKEELYKTGNLFDSEHTNAAGAKLYTGYIARQFVEHVRKKVK